MSDMLAIEAVLCLKEWSIEQWDACYEDLPSRQCKLPVKDRSVIVCSEDETYVVEPAPLQERLNEAQGKHASYRCFVRPSGTEDVVRVYAEAQTVEEADRLAYEASLIVYEMAGGVGEPPVPM
jgi:phosphoacetylglucosamine mutase